MDDRVTSLLALGGAGLAAWIASGVVSRPVFAALAAGRDVHVRSQSDPIGRGGGVAVAVPVLLAALLFGWSDSHASPIAGLALVAALSISFLVGLVDDLRPLGPLAKFIGQCVAAAVLATAFAWSGAGWMVLVFAVLLSLWSQNAWNFIDGTDGLMATAGIAVFSVGGGLAWHAAAEPSEIVFLAGLVVAALLGFLPWNLPAARLFLGDAGSLFVGNAYALCTVLAFEASTPLGWAWLTLAAPIHADVLVCLLRRVVRRCRWWEGHREHAYQHVFLRHGSHGAALLLGGGLWLLVALPASIWAIESGWIAAAFGVGSCVVVVAGLGSGRSIGSVAAPVSKASPAEEEVALAPRRPAIPAVSGLAVSRLGQLTRGARESLKEVAVERPGGATFAATPLRK